MSGTLRPGWTARAWQLRGKGVVRLARGCSYVRFTIYGRWTVDRLMLVAPHVCDVRVQHCLCMLREQLLECSEVSIVSALYSTQQQVAV